MRLRHFWVLLVSVFFGGLSQVEAQKASDEAVQTVPVGAPTGSQLDASFANEPTLLEVYGMAKKEAGLHPEMIDEWWKGSHKKYWLPDLRLQARYVKDDDLAEGPAFSFQDDPDRTIERDELDFTREDDNQYQVEITGVWALPELIFARQDTKDIALTQSRVLAMRQALLERLSEMYYQRRRLQVELQVSPPAAPLARQVMQLRIEELTAELDALTGGGFSSRAQGGGK